MIKDRYSPQGELQVELTEKIKIGIEYVDDKHLRMLADDLCDLISLAINNNHLNSEQKLEMINSRAGMYLNNYVPKNKRFPDHVMKELAVMRG